MVYTTEERSRLLEMLRDPKVADAFFTGIREKGVQELAAVDAAIALWGKDKFSKAIAQGLRLLDNNLYIAFDLIEIVTTNQIKTRSEIEKLIEALKTQTLTKDELGVKLEQIRNELAIPEDDRKNIEWMRKYLTNASKANGDDMPS